MMNWTRIGLCFLFALSGLTSVENASARTKVLSLSEGVYENASETPVYELIRSAQKSIDIEIYQMQDPNLRKELRQSLAKGVRIRILHEPSPVGDRCHLFDDDEEEPKMAAPAPRPVKDSDCKDLKAFMQEVREEGGVFEAFNRDELCGEPGKVCYEHGKLMIVDREKALISSGNFNATNLCDLTAKPDVCNRDYTYLSRDLDIIQSLEAVFEKDLNGKRYDIESVLSKTAASKLTISPISLEPLLAFIKSAKSKIQIQNQYFKETNINKALIAAGNRGVKIELTVASPCSFGTPKDSEAKKFEETYSAFEDAGIKTQVFTQGIKVGGKPGYLHAKAIVVDNNKAWVGSVNGSMTAVSRNREFGIFFDNAQEVGELSSILKKDQTDSMGETWEQALECEKDFKKSEPFSPVTGLFSLFTHL